MTNLWYTLISAFSGSNTRAGEEEEEKWCYGGGKEVVMVVVVVVVVLVVVMVVEVVDKDMVDVLFVLHFCIWASWSREGILHLLTHFCAVYCTSRTLGPWTSGQRRKQVHARKRGAAGHPIDMPFSSLPYPLPTISMFGISKYRYYFLRGEVGC